MVFVYWCLAKKPMNSTIYPGQLGSQPGFLQRSWWHLKDHVVPHARNHYQPHLLHHRTLAAFSVLLLTIKVFSFAALEFTPSETVTASAITQSSVLELTNKARAGSNIGQVTYNAVLERAAQAKADDMLARQYFAHNTPDGKTPWTFFEAVGYKYLSAGENLAVHFNDVEPLQDAWMNSPGHRANILNSSFKEMGVGISRGVFEGHDSIFVVEEFGNPAGTTTPVAPVAVAPQPAPAPAPVQAVVSAPTKLIKPSTASAAPVQNVQRTTVQPVQVPAASPALSPKLAIERTSLVANGEDLLVSAFTSSNVAKLLLVYGEKSQFFKPHSDGSWSVAVPVKTAQAAENLTVKAFDLQGNEVSTLLTSVAPTFADRYVAAGTVDSASVTVLGQKIPVKPIEQKAYLGIIALLLTALVIAIVVHRHIQHVRLIANTAFVVVFATMLLLF